ncbi:DUF58 domain-containing protein [Thermosipho atlanticus]|uniref:Uncharacterized protein n=1 Tax=Thermosipho atlanticus DSM 15807 TaxID=1123380 RepID=A0A1M5TJD4_9BACT|nr:DUF58 domain-containing protein [Thermosipho atlanticus]SHH50814.1 Protein of unknown function DUF58 [Thermosipho atlanticus DSM 15807]
MEVQNIQLIFFTTLVIFLNFLNINGISLFLLAIVIVEWVNLRKSITLFKKIKVRAKFEHQRALIDEIVELILEIKTGKNVKLTISIPELAINQVEAVIKREKMLTFHHSYYTRGKKKVDKIFLRMDSLFFKIIKKFEVDAEIFVLPNFEMVRFNKEKLLELIPNLLSHLKLLEDPTYIIGVKEYNNDPVRKIHWKLSAKFDNLLVKKYEYTSQGKLFIALFLNLHPEIFSRKAWIPILKKYTEDIISGVAGIIKDVSEKNISTKLLIDTKDGVKSVFSKNWIVHFDLLAQAYASVETYNYDIYEEIENEIQYNDTLLIISMYLTEKDIPYILRLREKSSKIIVLILPYGFRSYQTKKFKTYLNIPPDIVELQRKALVLRENNIFVEVYSENTAFQEGLELVD